MDLRSTAFARETTLEQVLNICRVEKKTELLCDYYRMGKQQTYSIKQMIPITTHKKMHSAYLLFHCSIVIIYGCDEFELNDSVQLYTNPIRTSTHYSALHPKQLKNVDGVM